MDCYEWSVVSRSVLNGYRLKHMPSTLLVSLKLKLVKIENKSFTVGLLAWHGLYKHVLQQGFSNYGSRPPWVAQCNFGVANKLA